MTPATTTPDPDLVRLADEAERRYLRSLPPEHFMEATDHATQRKITLESFDLIHAARPDVQAFNELLVQYPGGGRKRFKQVVPDNFVVIHPDPIQARGNFTTSLQPARPFLVLEYVSKHNERKDYEDNFDKYERELKVPYYLLFYPDNRELTVFRLADGRYAAVMPNPAGRLAVPELELEAAVLDGWVRYWFRGELLPLPAELQGQLRAAEERATAAERRAAEAERAAREAAERAKREADERAAELAAEIARLKAELARAQGGGTP